MSAQAMQSAIGEDGSKAAVDALKDVASSINAHDGDRIAAASTLLSYGFASEDALGNTVRG